MPTGRYAHALQDTGLRLQEVRVEYDRLEGESAAGVDDVRRLGERAETLSVEVDELRAEIARLEDALRRSEDRANAAEREAVLQRGEAEQLAARVDHLLDALNASGGAADRTSSTTTSSPTAPKKVRKPVPGPLPYRPPVASGTTLVPASTARLLRGDETPGELVRTFLLLMGAALVPLLIAYSVVGFLISTHVITAQSSVHSWIVIAGVSLSWMLGCLALAHWLDERKYIRQMHRQQ